MLSSTAPAPLPPLQACLLLLLPSTTRLEDLPPGTAASWLRTWSPAGDGARGGPQQPQRKSGGVGSCGGVGSRARLQRTLAHGDAENTDSRRKLPTGNAVWVLDPPLLDFLRREASSANCMRGRQVHCRVFVSYASRARVDASTAFYPTLAASRLAHTRLTRPRCRIQHSYSAFSAQAMPSPIWALAALRCSRLLRPTLVAIRTRRSCGRDGTLS